MSAIVSMCTSGWGVTDIRTNCPVIGSVVVRGLQSITEDLVNKLWYTRWQQTLSGAQLVEEVDRQPEIEWRRMKEYRPSMKTSELLSVEIAGTSPVRKWRMLSKSSAGENKMLSSERRLGGDCCRKSITGRYFILIFSENLDRYRPPSSFMHDVCGLMPGAHYVVVR